MFDLTPDEVTAVLLSLRVALWSMAASLPAALLVACVLSRYRFPGKTLIDGLVQLPLILPPVVTGFALLVLLGRHGLVGGWLDRHLGLVFAFRWTGAAVASAVMGFPLMVQAIRLSLDGVDRRLEDAARTLGANRPWVFLTVTLPLILPGVLAGCVLAFAKSLGEFGATITFVSNIPGETQTLPLAIYTLTQVPGGDAGALRLTAVSVLLALVAVAVAGPMSRAVSRRVQGHDAGD